MKMSSRFLPLVGLLSLLPWARADQPAPEPARAKTIEHQFMRLHDEAGLERETVPFLGVETARVPPALSAQLSLPAGSGLVVRSVVPKSPAAVALQEHDVLLKLDDQLLIETRQLAVLVRQHKAGDEVVITFVRAGKESTAKVKLTTHEVPKVAEFEAPGPSGSWEHFIPHADATYPASDVNRVLSLLPEEGNREPRINRRVRIPGGPALPATPGIHALRVNPGNSNIVFSDEAGALELTIKDGKKSLSAKNAKGEALYDGPIDTPEQRKALPAEVAKRLEQLEGLDGLGFKSDENLPHEFGVWKHSGQKIAFPLPEPETATAPTAF